MKRVIAIADRAALVSLKLLAALNLLFFLSFIVVLLLASRAHAEAPGCAGTDLLTALEKNDPAAFRKVETEAAAVPNGKGLLWKLDKPGEKPSYLFGTMHVLPAYAVGWLVQTSTFLMAIAMGAMGLSTHLGMVRKTGWRAVGVGMVGFFVLFGFSFAAIHALGL